MAYAIAFGGDPPFVPYGEVYGEWMEVGDEGNAADDTGHGAVDYVYWIGEFEVNNTQYTEFLNAVAATDTNGLYNTNMSISPHGGIDRAGGVGTYTYTVQTGEGYYPVNYTDFWDTLRYVNWLENGKPSGAQDSSTTEDGTYTITAGGIAANSITRNSGHTYFLPSQDEWYKAAYYDPALGGYYNYPYRTDTATTCAAVGGTPNTANCTGGPATVTPGGGYPKAISPSGVYDMGGNVMEWTEEIDVANRVMWGGAWSGPAGWLSVTGEADIDPSIEANMRGFRVARDE
jgi:formylglycine-generating enzyme required for sulfatase activity